MGKTEYFLYKIKSQNIKTQIEGLQFSSKSTPVVNFIKNLQA